MFLDRKNSHLENYIHPFEQSISLGLGLGMKEGLPFSENGMFSEKKHFFIQEN